MKTYIKQIKRRIQQHRECRYCQYIQRFPSFPSQCSELNQHTHDDGTHHRGHQPCHKSKTPQQQRNDYPFQDTHCPITAKRPQHIPQQKPKYSDMKSRQCQHMANPRHRIRLPQLIAQLFFISHRQCGKYGKFLSFKSPLPITPDNLISASQSLLLDTEHTRFIHNTPISGIHISSPANLFPQQIRSIIKLIRITSIVRRTNFAIEQDIISALQGLRQTVLINRKQHLSVLCLYFAYHDFLLFNRSFLNDTSVHFLFR